MEFSEFNRALQKKFAELTKNAAHLFEVEADKDELWNLYLDSFPEGTNEIYRECREYDCHCCRHFIKTIGNCVAIHDNQIHTVWDLELGDAEFQPVADALSGYLKSRAVTDAYISSVKTVGTERNYKQLADGKIETYEHFYLKLPDKLVAGDACSAGRMKGELRDRKNVFVRSLKEITEESIQTVLELIAQNSLYRGEGWKKILSEFLKYKKEWEKLETSREKENFALE